MPPLKEVSNDFDISILCLLACPYGFKLKQLNPCTARELISQHLFDMSNVEINLVGDFADLKEVESLLLKYLGTIPPLVSLPETPSLPAPSFPSLHTNNLVLSLTQNGPMKINFTTVPQVHWEHMKEDESRAIVYLIFPTFNRWGEEGAIFDFLHKATRSEEKQTAVVSAAKEITCDSTKMELKKHKLWKARVTNLMVEVTTQHKFPASFV